MISSPSVFDWNNNHMVDEMVCDGLHSPGLCIIKQFDNQWMYACTHTGHHQYIELYQGDSQWRSSRWRSRNFSVTVSRGHMNVVTNIKDGSVLCPIGYGGHSDTKLVPCHLQISQRIIDSKNLLIFLVCIEILLQFWYIFFIQKQLMLTLIAN